MQEETIAGIASGMGGGISIIRISGENALQVVGSIFRTKKYLSNLQKEEKENTIWKSDYFEKKETHTVHYGFIVNDQEEILDEVIVVLMKGPNSYTKEDVVEIDTHGGNYVVKKILNELLHHGARLAEPGEFTKRAFLNGRIDLSQAEAVMKLISSQNDFSYQSALNQLEGEVSQYIEKIRQDILHQLGYIEAALDDPEHISLDGFAEQLREIMIGHIQKLNKLLLNFDDGRMKSEGINTVIVGKPNAGKSSLMNLLQPEAQMETGEVSEKIKRGRHTTRHSELIRIEKDTYVLDTPGFSSLFIHMFEEDEIKDYFQEFAPYEDECRFQGCSHTHEPDCGVKKALEEGKISKIRYDNYVNIYTELKEKRKW